MGTSFMWKKSVVENSYKCPQCGKVLFKHGEPTNNLGVDASTASAGSGNMYCLHCKNLVGQYKEFDESIDFHEVCARYGIDLDSVQSTHDAIIRFVEVINQQEQKIEKLKSIKNDIRDFDAIIHNLEMRNSALKDKIKSLEKQISTMSEEHRKELQKCDNEINRLNAILEGRGI